MPGRPFALIVVTVAATAAACGSDKPESSAAARRGREVAQDWGCLGCHSTEDEAGTGPAWEGIWGSTVQLADGRTVSVDRDYITRSIREPDVDVVEGFEPVMPTFNLSDEQIEDVAAYIRALGDSD